MIRKTLMHIKVRRFAFKRERLSVHKLWRLRWSQKNLNTRSGFVPVGVPSSDRTMKLARSARACAHNSRIMALMKTGKVRLRSLPVREASVLANAHIGKTRLAMGV